MKIAILTQPLWGNYGGILQNFALQRVLKRLGHKPYTIHYYKQSVTWRFLFEWIKYIVKCVIRHPNRKYRPRSIRNFVLNRNNGVAPFVSKHIDITYPIKGVSKDMISKYNFDAYIVGSDQTWRPVYNWGDRLYYMYLDFVEDNDSVKKIAYAASFGVDNWEYSQDQTNKCKELIKKFDAISVREVSGIALCRDYLNVDAQHLLDPTLLLSADDYRSLIKDKDFGHQGDVCVYILGMTEDKQRLINDFCNKNNLCWYQVGALLKNGDMPSIESWLAGFDKAKYVITDSFHGSVFSIIFNKPFVSIGNIARGMSRFKSLLEMFNLDNRLVSENDELKTITPPNWEAVNAILSEWQEKSINFLKTNLS